MESCQWKLEGRWPCRHWKTGHRGRNGRPRMSCLSRSLRAEAMDRDVSPSSNRTSMGRTSSKLSTRRSRGTTPSSPGGRPSTRCGQSTPEEEAALLLHRGKVMIGANDVKSSPRRSGGAEGTQTGPLSWRGSPGSRPKRQPTRRRRQRRPEWLRAWIGQPFPATLTRPSGPTRPPRAPPSPHAGHTHTRPRAGYAPGPSYSPHQPTRSCAAPRLPTCTIACLRN